MTDITLNPRASRLPAWLRGFGIRQLRLVSGTVLFTFLVSHFLNHALGNLSLETMESALITHNRIWQGEPVRTIFYLSALIHTSLGIWMLYERRQFAWGWTEGLQLVLGLSIPALIVAHVADARLAYSLYGHEKYYAQLFYLYGVSRPGMALVQYTVLIVSWVHGCIGLYFWLSLKKWFRPIAPLLLALAVLLPTLAALGLFQGARTVKQLQQSEAWRAENLSQKHIGVPEQRAALDTITDGILIGYAALLALALGARGIRALNDRRGGAIQLSYGNNKTVRVPRDLTVLEASLRNNIAHASACGGRARCSTCRIRILGDLTPLPPPSRRESFVLDRIGVGHDRSIRLACQLKPGCNLSFVQLLQAGATTPVRPGHSARNGQERYVVSMFIDMRGSTKLAETRLPFDTVFIINRFLTAVSQAVVASGGEPNQFVGDGQLALFGLATDPQTACRQAIEAATLIAQNVAELNALLCSDLADPLCFGIGIHGGEVIVGDIGSPGHVVFTALGDPVNVTARLQDLTKSLACEVVLSEDVRRNAGLPDDCLPLTEVIIRGRNEPMLVRTAQAAELATIVGGAKPTLA